MGKLGQWLLAHPRNAGMLVFFVAVFSSVTAPFGVLFAWLGGATLSLVTLAKGPRPGARILMLAMIPGVLVAAILIAMRLTPSQREALLWGVLWHDILAGVVCVWFAAVVLSRTHSWAAVMQALALLGAVSVLCLHTYFGDMAAWWQQHFHLYLDYLQKMVASADISTDEQTEITNFLSYVNQPNMLTTVSRVFTGMSAAFLFMSDIFIVLLGRAWQAALYNPGALSQELKSVRMGYAFTGLLIVTALGVAMDLPIAYDVIPLMLLPYFLAGLSLVHSIVLRFSWRWVLIVAFYVLLIWQGFFATIALVSISVIDVFVDFRRRMEHLA